MKMIYNVIEFVISFIETFMAYKILHLFFRNKLKNQKKEILVLLYSIAITICIYLNNQRSLFSNFLLLFVILAISISAVCLFKIGFFQSLTVVAIYYLMITIIDLFTIFILSICTSNREIGWLLTSEMNIYRCIYICFMKFCLLLGYMWLRKIDFDKKLILKYWGFWLALCVISYSAIFYFQRFAIEKLTEVLASNWLLFLIILLMLAIIFFMYIKYRDFKEKNALINVRNEILEKSYTNFQNILKDNEHVFHDFKNHLTAIAAYIEKNENEKALDYINFIAKPIGKLENTVWSGIEIVDTILNCKIAEAENYDINMELDIRICACKVDDSDYCIILSNLLDNAIESAIRDMVNKRYIKFIMKSINNMLIIKIRNNMLIRPNSIESNKFDTLKIDKKHHGIGLESVKHSVNKYDGNIKFNLGEDYFEVQIMLLSV